MGLKYYLNLQAGPYESGGNAIKQNVETLSYDINAFITSNIDLRKRYKVRVASFAFFDDVSLGITGISNNILGIQLPDFDTNNIFNAGNGRQSFRATVVQFTNETLNTKSHSFDGSGSSNNYVVGQFGNTANFRVKLLDFGFFDNDGTDIQSVGYVLKLAFEEYDEDD